MYHIAIVEDEKDFSAQLVEYLERNGMIVRHLKSFSLPEWIRVTIGKPEENQLFVDLVQKWKAL